MRPVNPDNYIQRAFSKLKKDNKISTLSILEEGYARFHDNQISELLEKTRAEFTGCIKDG